MPNPAAAARTSSRIAFIVEEPLMPRTVYWQEFIRACENIESSDAAVPISRTLHLPAEDLAIETNWPRFARAPSCYVRGQAHDLRADGFVHQYLCRVLDWSRKNPQEVVLLVNMHPLFRLPVIVSECPNVITADGCLSTFERSVNPRTISMPALPLNAGTPPPPGSRPVLASFQGAPSHPIRARMAELHDGDTIIVNLIDPGHHDKLRLDAINRTIDSAYQNLLARSTFAFVPRGDALFSYRLLEALSFGCVPVILSDGWVLPFDRLIGWSNFAYLVHYDALETAARHLRSVTPQEILRRQRLAAAVYSTFFGSFPQVIMGLLAEVGRLMGPQITRSRA